MGEERLLDELRPERRGDPTANQRADVRLTSGRRHMTAGGGTCVGAGGQRRRRRLQRRSGLCVRVVGGREAVLMCHVQLLQCCGKAGVSSGASHGERQAAQRVRDPQSPTVPAVQELCCPLVTQSARPHLEQTVCECPTTPWL